MLTIKNYETAELYNAPSCKVVSATFNRAILAESGPFNVDDIVEEDW